jgi:hypothetical protein
LNKSAKNNDITFKPKMKRSSSTPEALGLMAEPLQKENRESFSIESDDEKREKQVKMTLIKGAFLPSRKFMDKDKL